MSSSVSSRGGSASWARRWLRKILSLCAICYPVSLALLGALLYLIGERWWVTAAALYVPRLALGVPLPFICLALWAFGPRRLLWSQLVAGALLAVPLMGLVVPGPKFISTGRTIRVLSFNVNSGFAGPEPIIGQVMQNAPDVVLLEEAPYGGAPYSVELLDGLRARFPFVKTATDFVIASKFRIAAVSAPKLLVTSGPERSPRFMRYVLDSPIGSLAVYCVHPISPRGVLHVYRFHGAFQQLVTGALFAGNPEAQVMRNASLRALQIASASDAAASETLPVVIAGDTNLPGLSAVYRRWLSNYEDGFRAAGWGFGYTFPTPHPFLRLDRILVSHELGFASFQVGCHGVSDHLCVVADIAARQ
jgi:vancomycin resistance protein VanJ